MQDLSHNHITVVPGDLGFLSFLNALNLSHNQITELPEDLGGLTGYKTFSVCGVYTKSRNLFLKNSRRLDN